MSTGSISGYNNEELDLTGSAEAEVGEIEVGGVASEIIRELRESLGAIPEVVALHGEAEDEPFLTSAYKSDAAPNPYNNDELKLTGSGEAEEDEEDELESGGGTEEEEAAIFGGSPAVPQAPSAGPYVSTSAELNPSGASAPKPMYIDSLQDIGGQGGGLLRDSDKGAPAASGPPTAQSEFETKRRELDLRMAKMAQFLPEKTRLKLDGAFQAAVKKSRDQTDEAYEAATEGLGRVSDALDKFTPTLRKAECEHLRKQIGKTLARDGDVLTPDDRKWYEEQFSKLDVDTPAGEEEAKQHLSDLQMLSENLDGAIETRIKAISDLAVDYERLTPILKRALAIEHDEHVKLDKAVNDLNAGFAGEYVKKCLTVEAIDGELKAVETLASSIFKDFTLDDALKEQKASLPADPDSLKPKGDAFASGNFGSVYHLANDADKPLVGKLPKATDDSAKKEMEHEAEIYARIGEHPNIARCYGMQEVDTDEGKKEMLVMDEIEGEEIADVFDKLDKRYRKGKLSREEYLAGLQHLMKGTLMGLAHMESLGLVHKDIKGDNIKFDPKTNQPMLIDMGLAQPEGAHEQPKSWVLIEPPENRAGRQSKDDKVVTNVWDSFTAGKLLFEEMERDQSGKRHILTPGQDPVMRSDVVDEDNKPHSLAAMAPYTGSGAKKVLGRNAGGELEATTDASGELVGKALKRGEDADEAGDVGYYGAETAYVDFMNRLTHPDPSLRMTASEALKHPFMAQALSEGRDMESIFKSKKKKDADAEDLDPEDFDAEDFDPDEKFITNAEGYVVGRQDASSGEQDASSEQTEDDSSREGAASLFDDEHPDPYQNDQVNLAGGEEESEEDSEEESAEVSEEEEEPDTYQNAELNLEGGVEVAPVATATKSPPQSREEVKRAMAGDASPLKLWQTAEKQIEQQFNAAYSMLKDDKAALKAAGFTKGDKFSKYFTYNKGLDKLINKLEKSHAKGAKTVAKDKAAVLEATKHYHEKIVRKATEDFGWVNADPPIKTPFWKTMIVALNEVDHWVKGLT